MEDETMKKMLIVLTILGLFSLSLLAGCGGGGGGEPSSSDAYEYVSEWNLPGTAPHAGLHLAADSQFVFVSLYQIGDDSVYMYQTNGTYIRDLADEVDVSFSPDQPMGIAYNSGFVYVADQINSRVVKIDPVHFNALKATSYDNTYGVFGLAFFSNTIYVTRNNGALWVVDKRNPGDVSPDFSVSYSYDTSDLESLAVDSNGYTYVVDRELDKVYKFSANLTKLLEWGSSGGGNGQFNNPYDITIGSEGTVFVLDTGNYRVQLFDSDGNYLGKFGSFGTGPGKFGSMFGLAVSNDGYVYVGDTHYSGPTATTRIQKFRKK
jgi:tripartite motif-containing protein 71